MGDHEFRESDLRLTELSVPDVDEDEGKFSIHYINYIVGVS